MFADFIDTAAFLDIETTGLSPDSSVLTMVGILDARGYHAFVRGENLDDLPDAVERYDLIVTFTARRSTCRTWSAATAACSTARHTSTCAPACAASTLWAA